MRARGFTLIELLLSVSIIGLLVGVSLPIYNTFVTRNDLDLSAQNVASALRRAQTFSRAMNGDSQWGVRVATGSAVLFKGATYATRDTAYDETTTIPPSITPSGLNEITFAKLSAAPSTTGSVVLTLTTNDTRTVTINAKGMVTY